ncbi:MAG: glycosyltransferase [Dinoroseobacter sp.]|nr:glycosyltransferase [Dinoroseobacter sp.]
MFTIIIPSYNEENYIASCLEGLLAQVGLDPDHGIQVIVAANGCHDRTVEISRSYETRFADNGFTLTVLDIKEPGKTNALNRADQAAEFEDRAYLDADVVLSPPFLAELAEAFQDDAPRYIGGTVDIPRSPSWATRAYAKVWLDLPFVSEGVPGIGFYAFNARGRARWQEFPKVYSDDRFVRLQFKPSERRKLKASYQWPLPIGFVNMIKARRRWSEGNNELYQKYPELLVNDSERNNSVGNVSVILRHPIAGVVFAAIYGFSTGLAKFHSPDQPFHWRRGRV